MKRPFRLYDSKTKKFLFGRNYGYKERAHIGALIQVRWAAVGTVIEVIDASISKMIGQYKRGVNDIKFMKGD